MAVAFAAVTVAWFGVLVAAPSLPAPFAALVYTTASFLCHQIPERSFYRDALQLPVCARCLGLYGGVALGALVAPRSTVAALLQGRTFRQAVLMAAMTPTLVTIVLERSGVWSTSNVERALTGIVLGVGLALVVRWAIATLHYERWRHPGNARP